MRKLRIGLYLGAAAINYLAAGVAHSWVNLVLALVMSSFAWFIYKEAM